MDEFRQPVEEIRYRTRPANRQPLEEAGTEIQFILNAERKEWETHKERLHALTRAVYEAWESQDREENTA